MIQTCSGRKPIFLSQATARGKDVHEFNTAETLVFLCLQSIPMTEITAI